MKEFNKIIMSEFKKRGILRNLIIYNAKISLKFFQRSLQLIDQIIFNIYRKFFKVNVYDCMIFHNELELLKLRLEYLKDDVDIFVIVEAKITFTGKLKDKFNAEEFLENLPLDLKNKIRYIQINPLHIPFEAKNDPWEVENYVRNAISYGLSDLRHFDFVWISDIDEIPNRDAKFKLGKLSMYFSNYKMNLLKNNKWDWSKAVLGKTFFRLSPQKIRMNSWKYGFAVKNGGWHFSFLMNVEQIIDKVKSFSFTNLNKKEYLDPIHLENCIKNGYDIFKRKGEDLHKENDLSFLPEIVRNNISKYKKFIIN